MQTQDASEANMKRVGFKAPESLVAEFTALAARKDLDMSKLLRRVMAQAIEQDREGARK